MRLKTFKCAYCKKSFKAIRKRRYCTRSHRQRAYEARRLKNDLASPLYALRQDLAVLKFRKVVVAVLREFGLIPEGERAEVHKLKLVKKDDK